MKKLKQSLLIHMWEEYEFFLNIPHNFIGSNKPFIYYYFKSSNNNKLVRIRKYLSKNNGDLKKTKAEAKTSVENIIELLKTNWNPITEEHDKAIITTLSSIEECIQYWIESRKTAYNNQSIGKSTLKNNRISMMHFSDYLKTHNLQNLKANAISKVLMKEFLDAKAFEKNWNKVSYNTYKIDVGTFFNYLLDLKIVRENPVRRVPKKSTKFDSSRFKVYEPEELRTVAKLLSNDKAFLGLYIASKILFKYNIRPIEIIRIQAQDIDFNKKTLTLPPTKTKMGLKLFSN